MGNMAIKEMRLEPATTAALVPVDVESKLIELASSPNFNPDTFRLLVDTIDRNRERLASEQFNAAMSAAQSDMRPVAADANNPQTKSKYATYGAIDKALRPIYTRHGFALSFDTGDNAPSGMVRVVCLVTHAGGYSRTYHIDMPADGKGAKGGDVMTLTHATGAATSYGRRYLVNMIWNISIGEDDRDGNAPEPPRAAAPKGYDDILSDLKAAAETGQKAFASAFAGLSVAVRTYATQHDRAKLEGYKAIAKATDKAVQS